MRKSWYLHWHYVLQHSRVKKAFWKFFGIDVAYTYVALIALGLFFERTRGLAFAIIAAFILGKVVVAYLIRKMFPRLRPYQEFGFRPVTSGVFSRVDRDKDSMPSGHAVSFAAITFLLCAAYPPLGLLSAVVSIFIMAGRVVLGYHHVTDVLVGMVVGALSGYAIIRLFSLYVGGIFW